MKWMVSLQSVSVRSRLSSQCLDNFFRWLIAEIDPPTLNTLWFPSIKNVKFSTAKERETTKLGLARLDAQMCSTSFSHLTHVAGVNVPVGFRLPQLRFLRGTFTSCLVSNRFEENQLLLYELMDGPNNIFY